MRLSEIVAPGRENYKRTMAFLRSRGITDDDNNLSDYGVELADYVFEDNLSQREYSALNVVYDALGKVKPDRDVLTYGLAEVLANDLPNRDVFAFVHHGSKHCLEERHVLTLAAMSIVERNLNNRVLVAQEQVINYNQ